MKNFKLNVDGLEQNVTAEIINRKIWFKLGGNVYSYEVSDLSASSYSKSKTAGKATDKITAPMPGKITKTFVSEGQAVNRGDALLVMEAMKMEFTLKSDITGTVEKLLVKSTDQVVLGQLLVQLKEAKQ